MNQSPVEFTPPARGKWVQIEREHLERWMHFATLKGAPAATRLMFALLSRMGDHNAFVASQKALSKLLGYDARTVRRAIAMLREHNWLEIRPFGERGGVNVYIVNDRIAWQGPRDGLRYSLFSANVLLSSEDQPDRDELDKLPPLNRVPDILPGERQMPAGAGLPPVSQAILPGMEMDMPAIERADPGDVSALLGGFGAQLRVDPETGEVFE